MKKLSILLLVCLSAFGLYGQTAQLIEKVEAQPGKAIIPFEKYKLPNGLTIIVHEDHSDPIVHLMVSYHVGSARELPGKSGFAHFFEHMLFQGSEHVADEEHFKIISNAGGEVNGNTTRDRTVYIQTFPSNFTETGLWMEADRMGFFLGAFTQKKYEIQRSTVKNEKDERYSGPYGFLQEVKDQNLYPPNHPYSWPVIGYVDDLDRVDSNDLKNFFLRWYGPNNATIVVSGDADAKQVVQWCEKYFGSFNRCPEIKKQRVSPVIIPESRFATFYDGKASVPVIMASWPGPPVYTNDEPALDILSQLLGGGKSSPLYKRFVEAEIALQANASNNPMTNFNHELAGEFAITIAGYPMSDVNFLRKRMFAVVDSFDIIGFSDEDLERVKNDLISNFYGIFESVESKAAVLNEYNYLMEGKSFNIQDDIERYRRVTREDILRVYRRYIKAKGASVVIVEPDPRRYTDPNFKPKPYESFNPNAGLTNPALEAEYQGLKYVRPVDNFDRSVMPKAGPAKPVTIPALYKEKLSNGVEIAGAESFESPLVFMSFNIDGGHLVEGTTVKNGTANMTADMMGEGTKNRSGEQLSKDLEKLGSSIFFSAGTTSTNVSVSCLKENLDATMAILEDMLFNPAFPKTEFDRTKKQTLESFNFMKNQRGAATQNAWNALMNYGTPFGTMSTGMQKDVEKLTIEDLKAFHAKYYAPELTKIVVVGSVTKDEAIKALSFLNKWKPTGATFTAPAALPKWESNHIFMVDFPNSEQSDIRIGFNALPYDATGEFFRAQLLNFPLGGNFNSRINLNLREEKAWTYGSRGGFSGAYRNLTGNWTFGASVKAQATDSAIMEVVKEINKYKKDGMTQEEFEFTRNSILASQALDYESNGQKAGFIYNIINRNLPSDYTRLQEQILRDIKREELNALAGKLLNTDRMVILVVGDAATLKPKLEKLGYGKVQMLDAFGQGKWKVNAK